MVVISVPEAPSMVTGFVAVLAAAVVLLPAMFGFGRSNTYAWIGFPPSVCAVNWVGQFSSNSHFVGIEYGLVARWW